MSHVDIAHKALLLKAKMENNEKAYSNKILINFIFTSIVILSILLLMFESRRYFLNSADKINTTLPSGIEKYKIKYEQPKQTTSYDISLSNALNSSIYETKPSITIQTIENIHTIENNIISSRPVGTLEEVVEENEIARDILENPLFKGYYVQVGVFSEKSQAKNSINNLFEKLPKDHGFNSYIETKYMNENPFYVSQIGVFSSKQDAISFCNRLQNINMRCLIVD